MTVEQWLGSENKLGQDIWNLKYKRNNETFDEWLNRVSGNDDEVKQLIIDKKFLFGGRILANRGTNQTTSNCFILDEVEDSIDGIMKQCERMAKTYKSGGGCGFSLDKIRPKGSIINGQENKHPGLIEFMQLFSSVTGSISGNNRRGALSLIIDCLHPDVIDFINSKKDKNNGITKANISVKINKEFLEKANNNVIEERVWHIDDTNEDFKYTVDYKKIYDNIVELSRTTAEPGVVYWDTANNYTLCSGYKQYNIVGLNPCMEVSGIAYDACLLGSMMLDKYVEKDKTFNIPEFKKDVKIAVRALNNVQEEGIKTLPLQEQRDTATKTRQIGLGVAGMATALIKMGIKYGSKKACLIIEDIVKCMLNTAVEESANIAKIRGTFEGYDLELTKKSPMWNLLFDDVKHLVEQNGLANLKLLSIAPTGSLATMIDVSSGIEPYFRLSYTRKTESLKGKDEYYEVKIPLVEQYLKENNTNILPEYFVDSSMIEWHDRINMQASAQKYVDNSISSTINLPRGTTHDEIYELYEYGYQAGLKGLTIYVDGTLDSQILIDKNSEENKEEKNVATYNKSDIVYYQRDVKIGCGELKLLIGYDTRLKRIHDYFTIRVGSGGCTSNINSMAILASKYLKNGGNVDEALSVLNGSEPCNSFVRQRTKGIKLSNGKNCATAIFNTLKELEDELKNTVPSKNNTIKNEEGKDSKSKMIKKSEEKKEVKMICELCGGEMVSTGGCFTCSCGNTHCD